MHSHSTSLRSVRKGLLTHARVPILTSDHFFSDRFLAEFSEVRRVRKEGRGQTLRPSFVAPLLFSGSWWCRSR